jgi:hypothetical protein
MATFDYQLSGPSVREVQQELDRLWESLNTDRESLRRAQQARISLAKLPAGRRGQLIKVRRKGAGLEPATTAIVVVIGLGAKVLRDVWKHILLPRLRKKYGDQALKETVEKKAKKTNKKRT